MNALPPNQIYIEILNMDRIIGISLKKKKKKKKKLKRMGRTDVVVFLAMCCPVVHGPKPLEKKKSIYNRPLTKRTKLETF